MQLDLTSLELPISIRPAIALSETLERPGVVKGHGPVAGFELRATRLWSVYRRP